MTSKRDISTANDNALSAKVVRPIIYARLDFSSGVQRYHTGIGPKTATHPIYGSESYTGIGDFGGIQGDVVESVSGGTQVLQLRLSGVNASLVNIALVDDYYRRDAELMIGLENESGSLVANPEILFSGFMEYMTISLKQQTGDIVLRIEGRGSNLQRASDLRVTDEDKQREVNGDLLAEYVYLMADLELFWGDKEFTSPLPNRGGRGGRARRSRQSRRGGGG
jgi:hypothetical protein